MATDAKQQTMATDTENGSFGRFQACALPASVIQIAFGWVTTQPNAIQQG
jgi:hypothetical protein